MVFSPDGARLATAGWEARQPIRILDPQTGKVVKETRLSQDSSRIDALAFTPDGSLLLALDSSAGTVDAYNTTSWELAQRLTIPEELNFGIEKMRVSPDGSLVALADYSGAINFWEVGSDSLMPDPVQLPYAVRTREMAFSPDGRLLAVVGTDNRVRIIGVAP